MTIMRPVASAVAMSEPPVTQPIERPNRTAVGTIIWLSSELMFFAALFAIYYTLRANSPDLWAERSELLNVPFASVNTTILVLSSVTCQLGVLRAERGQVGRLGGILEVGKWGLREWFIVTYIMGAIFIGGQVYEYAELYREALTLASDPYGSIFYLATGIHGLHVTGGLIAFLFVLGRTYMARRFTHEQATSAIVVSYYWHFVDVVWIGLFFTIYVIQ
jgi:cytochrome c oxidase subunit 3